MWSYWVMSTGGPSKRERSAPVAGVAAALAVTVGLTWGVQACSDGTLEADAGTDAPSTVILGDSITRLSASEIVAATGGQVVAFNGATWGDMGPAMQRTFPGLKELPQRAAVLLGANDVLEQTVNATDFGLLDSLAEVPCVVILDMPTTLGGLQNSLNAAMHAEVEEHPNMTNDDEWSVLANRNLEDDDGSWFEPDRIHPNVRGRKELAAAYASALDRHCGSDFG